jgi:hypothetical protein
LSLDYSKGNKIPSIFNAVKVAFPLPELWGGAMPDDAVNLGDK